MPASSPAPALLPRRIAAAALAACLAALPLAACGRDPAAPSAGPPSQTALPPGTWAMAVADGQPLPAVVAHEQPGDGSYLQTFADSAQITVTADARYEQRVWLRTVRYADGAILGRPSLVDRGRLRAAGDGSAQLESDYQAWRRASRVRRLAPDAVEVVEQVGHELGGLVIGEYRRR